jgi:hypothetical protein
MNTPIKFARILIAATATLGLGLGLTACGSSGPPSLSSLAQEARGAIGSSCTPKANPAWTNSKVVESQIYCNPDFDAYALRPGATLAQWRSTTGNICQTVVAGSGWVIVSVPLQQDQNALSKVAQSTGGEVDEPATAECVQ